MKDNARMFIPAQLLVLLAAIGGIAATADASPPVTISGTIHYAGALEPVSRERPLRIFVFDTPELDGDVATVVAVTHSSGAFVVEVPAPGSYYFGYLLDLNDDGEPNLGEPFEIYNDRRSPPGDPVTTPRSDLALDFDDSKTLPGVAGTATYTGNLGTVSPETPLRLEVFADPDFGSQITDDEIEANGGRYEIIVFDPVYMRVFLDMNGDNVLGPCEPFEIYNNRSAPPGDPVAPGPEQTNVNLSFGDENTCPTPTATPPPTRTPTLIPTIGPCYGDCNSDGQVAVAELVRGVNMALGRQPVAGCPAFDSNSDGSVSVNELIQAVGAALRGCRTM